MGFYNCPTTTLQPPYNHPTTTLQLFWAGSELENVRSQCHVLVLLLGRHSHVENPRRVPCHEGGRCHHLLKVAPNPPGVAPGGMQRGDAAARPKAVFSPGTIPAEVGEQSHYRGG